MSDKIFIENVRGRKAGTDYLTIKIPKKILKELPDPCYFDIEIRDVRSGTSEKNIKQQRRKRNAY